MNKALHFKKDRNFPQLDSRQQICLPSGYEPVKGQFRECGVLSYSRKKTTLMESTEGTWNVKLRQAFLMIKHGNMTHILIHGFPGGSDGKESACNAGDPGLLPGSGRSPEERNGYPLQYYQENSVVGWTWSAKVHGVANSRTRLSDFHFHFGLTLWLSW